MINLSGKKEASQREELWTSKITLSKALPKCLCRLCSMVEWNMKAQVFKVFQLSAKQSHFFEFCLLIKYQWFEGHVSRFYNWVFLSIAFILLCSPIQLKYLKQDYSIVFLFQILIWKFCSKNYFDLLDVSPEYKSSELLHL